MKAILLVLFTGIFLPAISQRACFTVEAHDEFTIAHPAINKSKLSEDIFKETDLSKLTEQQNKSGSSVIRIPVVVHILYNTAAQNISDAQVKSQIDALNRDFRKRNSDTVNIPDRFKSLAADVEIEFQLAVVNPVGVATNGIVRKQTSVKEWIMDDKIKFKEHGGDDAWDRNNYLNIWVGNIKKTLGYSSAINGPAEKDGIVIAYPVFGTIGISGAYNKGRTLVHEVGHWLGLKHIWGDEPCGDDDVDDTPKQSGFTSGCPTGFLSTCGAATGDMYMNYMDFTNDACMNLFTYGQKNRMRANFIQNGYRSSLLNSKGLDSSAIKETPIVITPAPADDVVDQDGRNAPVKILIYPNPADREVILKLNDPNWIGSEISIVTINGMVMQRVKITSLLQTIPVATLKQGLYLVVVENGNKKHVLKFVKSGLPANH